MSQEKNIQPNYEELIPKYFEDVHSRRKYSTNTVSKITNNSTDSEYGKLTSASLIEESKNLDRIIIALENVDKTLKNAIPSHLNRINEVCRSTNFILDTWIDIQNNAGSIHKLMNNKDYIELIQRTPSNSSQSATLDEAIEQEKREIEELKTKIDLEKQKQSSMNQQRKPAPTSTSRYVPSYARSISRSSANRDLNANQNNSSSRSRNRSSGIPNAPNRIQKPPYGSSRKMFR
ncbi:hypothetical protein TBLA_0F02470 [Henningerozyma blattae CBS 6284]|uniref:DASH complex subunit DUO1 n=1 Tax=Henningerozyma blattae (strain ATCC 34711 / CBS 6284 / DSM 70876 / NBRC 10599 / NRRL Y-10934 / UCD 77-7) TaxID=1071380 RepID=I2H5Y5_HENB6|nr:hypothetical protein TBLA_0F02470 [Tetrapisispora blattae CBS 6284]CCH61787.1 hypothetical protein TBLA_0F02470 [Tetrapisispora blattae CBS 6284]